MTVNLRDAFLRTRETAVERPVPGGIVLGLRVLSPLWLVRSVPAFAEAYRLRDLRTFASMVIGAGPLHRVERCPQIAPGRRGPRPDDGVSPQAGTAPVAPIGALTRGDPVPDTDITVVGRVATAPRLSRTDNGGQVTNFRIASTSRRFDRTTQDWADGETFWSDVECWGDLGGNVVRSISKGDPVVVVGRLWTRDYESQNGRGSTSQIRAESVGPDLRWGWAEYRRPARPVREEASSDSSAGPPADPEGSPFADDPLDAPPTSEDYVDTSAVLSSVDPDRELREPALH
jgi:single-strand DNA-binding protein